MKKLIYPLIAVCLILALLLVLPAAATAEFAVPLVTRNPTVVGGVVVERQGWSYLTVTYYAAEGWCLSKTHLHVAGAPELIPQNKQGKPILAHFDYQMRHQSETGYSYTYGVPLDNYTNYVAAHAVVCRCQGEEGGEGPSAGQCREAWGEAQEGQEGQAFSSKHFWGTYFRYDVTE